VKDEWYRKRKAKEEEGAIVVQYRTVQHQHENNPHAPL
jgi:hypothetical protein